MFYIILLFILSFLIISYIRRVNIYIKTSNMAVVMALGIFIHGVLFNYIGPEFFHGIVGRFIGIIILVLWVTFTYSFLLSLIKNQFIKLHLADPINRFAIGTWIAGTSICMIVVSQQNFNWEIFVETITFINIGFWILYMIICLKTFYEIAKKRVANKVHGILLLTTVSTQSVVILLNTVFDTVPTYVSRSIILLGIVLYLISIWFIIKRYAKEFWLLENDWNNTNCILHGAISITGIASLVSNSVPYPLVLLIWICASITFVMIEFIECQRGVKRIKLFGFKKGLFTYNVTQWARIFTFSMYYTLTYYINMVTGWAELILEAGIWIVLVLVFIQLLLSFEYLIQSVKRISKQPGSSL